MNLKFSPELTSVLSSSKSVAVRLHNSNVTPSHLLLAIIQHENNRGRSILRHLTTSLPEISRELEVRARRMSNTLETIQEDDIQLDDESSRVLRFCVLEARLMRDEVIDTHHILLAILKAGKSDACQVLEEHQVDYQHVAQTIRPAKNESQKGTIYELPENNIYNGSDDDEDDLPDEPYVSKAGTAQKEESSQGGTPVLDNFSTDLTEAARQGLLDPVVGRATEIERVAQILSRRKKNNPILIGQPGVGKSAIVEGLALRIVEHRASRHLWNKRVLTLDLAAVVAGTKYRGQFEERIRNIITELKQNPNIIVFIDEIHTMVGAGNATGSMDAANLLKPALARGEIQCIGATTTDEFRKTIEKDGALERRFQKVMVEPTTQEETLQILRQLQSRYEEFHHVRYTPEAIAACVALTERYVTDRCFPDKAIDAMDEAGSRMHIQDLPMSSEVIALEKALEECQQQKHNAVRAQNFEQAADFRDHALRLEAQLADAKKRWEESLDEETIRVDESHVAQVVSMATGIPVERVGAEESQRLRTLKQTLGEKVIGQDEAIDTLVRAIQRSRIGIKDPKKPIATFMFVGPTGVGKTHLTKILAEALFGRRDAVIRIDMSEYMEKHTVSRMVGAPPGYVGYDEGGQLTERVRRKPYSIVLLDEIEKAHSDVFNLLLQVMDEGRLTDGNGATIDFKNTIIIMTSNCGTRQLKDFGRGMGFAPNGSAEQNRAMSRSIVSKAIEKQFAPEFLNRLDNIIHFDQLSAHTVRQIVDLELQPLQTRVAAMGFKLEVTPQARELLGRKGYDVQYGARPVGRAIQSLLEDPLCQLLVYQDIAPGTTLVAQPTGEDKLEIIPQQ